MKLIGLVITMVLGWYLIDQTQVEILNRCNNGYDMSFKGRVVHCQIDLARSPDKSPIPNEPSIFVIATEKAKQLLKTGFQS